MNEHSGAQSAIPPTMRAVLLMGYGGLDKLEYREDIPTPAPGVHDVLVRVGACGVNNTDVNLRTGWYDRAVDTSVSEQVGLNGAERSDLNPMEPGTSWKGDAVGFPRIQGAAVAGRIVAVGSGVAAGRIGERVIVDPQIRDASRPIRAQLKEYLGGERDGGFAEYVVVPTENAYAVSTDLSDLELATFPTSYDTAEEMLERARLSSGETVVVTGAAGGVGTALIQLARVRGARVVALAGASKEGRLRELGVHTFVSRESGDVRARIEALTGPLGVDVVADVVGGALFGDLLKMLCRGGRYVSAGAIAGPVQPMDLRDLIYKDLEMYGITSATQQSFARVVSLVSAGRLRPLVDQRFKLAEIRAAQTEFVKRSHVGKFVIVP
jgi:NADPH:quinone reductase-like Zn-dependent oxidoreductase